MRRLFPPILLYSLLLLTGGCLSSGAGSNLLGGAIGVNRGALRVSTGMVGEEITEIFGAPSTVSSSGERGSIWVYDRVAAGQVVSEKVGDVTSLFFKGDEQGDRPRVFTVIVTFDGAGVARDFSYHTARF